MKTIAELFVEKYNHSDPLDTEPKYFRDCLKGFELCEGVKPEDVKDEREIHFVDGSKAGIRNNGYNDYYATVIIPRQD